MDVVKSQKGKLFLFLHAFTVIHVACLAFFFVLCYYNHMYTQLKNILQRLLIIFMIFLCASLGAEQYQIRFVEYEIEGKTREHPLKQTVEIDTIRIFTSLQAIENYLADLQIQFQNQRVLESTFITPTYGQPDAKNIIPIDLLISVKDSGSWVAIPYPDYDSNSGLELKVKFKDYNFLGSMMTLDAEIDYIYDEYVEDKHTFGGSTSFSLPFQLGVFNTSWSNKLGLGYTIGQDAPKFNFSTGLNFSYPINEIISINFGATQGITYDPNYKKYGDAFYLTQEASFAIPITLARTDTFGNISWTPSTSVTYYWDFDGINKNNEDLIDTNLNVSHSFSFGRVNWIGNFREGFSFSVSQAFSQQTHVNKFSVSASLDTSYFKAFKHVGFATSLHIFHQYNGTSEVGEKVRGIRNSYIDTNSALIINFELPIKVWQTDWVGYGLWNWTEIFDFELQISPFIDIAIGNNLEAGSNYSLKDGWYGAGIEVLGFLNKSRSIVGRVSVGIDIVQVAEKIGNRIDFVDKIVNKLFNTDWRDGEWWELSFGVGLHF